MHGQARSRRFLIAAAVLPALAALHFYLRHHSTAYLVFAAVALAGLYAVLRFWDRLRSLRPGAVLLVLLSLALPALGLWQFLAFQDPGDFDHACYGSYLWNLRNADGFSSFTDFHAWASHSNYAMALWQPVHVLAGEAGLKAGKILCLLAAAWLMVLVRKEDREEAAWAAAALLLSPPVISQFCFGFHPEFLAAPAIILAMFAYRDRRLGRFLLCTAFLAWNKEPLTLVIAGLLLVALAERRPWKWILLPGLLCCVQMALFWFVIAPRYQPAGHPFAGTLPASAGNALGSFASPSTWSYWSYALLPFLPLLLAAPRRYLLAPLPLLAFYSVFPDWSQNLWRHYAFPIPFLCLAGYLLPARHPGGSPEAPADGAKPLTGDRNLSMGKVLALCAAMGLLAHPLARAVMNLPDRNVGRGEAIARILGKVPADAPVLVHGRFASRLAARRTAASWEYRVQPFDAFSYAVIDSLYDPPGGTRRGELDADIRTLSSAPDWARIDSGAGLILFRRGPADP